MSYQYPPIQATNPEETPAIPATRYEFWAITRVSNVVTNIVEEDDGGTPVLKPQGTMTIRGKKYESVNGVINPTGADTSFSIDDLVKLFNDYPELGNAYNAFILGFAPILEMVDNQQGLLRMDAATFENHLRWLRDAFRALDADDMADKVTEALAHYPAPWSMEEVLAFLGLRDEVAAPVVP